MTGVYLDKRGYRVAVFKDLDKGLWGSFYCKPYGQMTRVRAIGLSASRAEALDLLRQCAKARGWKRIE